MITHDMIGADEDLAREVLVIGRDIAPCIDKFGTDTEEQKNAVSILRRVFKDVSARGSMHIRSQGVASSSVSYADVTSAFDGQPRRALLSLCSAQQAAGGLPQGSFPLERPISRMWPEGY